MKQKNLNQHSEINIVEQELIDLVEVHIVQGTNPSCLAGVMLGCGADLLREMFGHIEAARIIHGLALDVLNNPVAEKAEVKTRH
jgi:hypothetical protein